MRRPPERDLDIGGPDNEVCQETVVLLSLEQLFGHVLSVVIVTVRHFRYAVPFPHLL